MLYQLHVYNEILSLSFCLSVSQSVCLGILVQLALIWNLCNICHHDVHVRAFIVHDDG